MDCLDYFSDSYSEARDKFKKTATSAGAQLVSYVNPAPSPDGTALTTDVALLGNPSAINVLLVTSGTHGVEGFCGSGAQIGWLQSEAAQRLKDNFRLVFVHAINPSGFAWLRRVTEGNIDLNRNFFDHSKLHPDAPEYAALHPFVLPDEWNEDRNQIYDQTMADINDDPGQLSAQVILTKGQYQIPEGIFYGGREPTWSNRTFQEIILSHVKAAKKICFIDFHTGLGPYGTAELIHREPVGTEARQRLENWFQHGLTSLADGTTLSAASQDGLLETGLTRLLPNSEVTALTMEFGTVPFDRVLKSLLADNWLHIRGDLNSPLAKQIKTEIKNCFYPRENDWKELVYLRSRQILDRAVAGLTEK